MTSKSLAFVTALMTVLALAIPFVGTAIADTDNSTPTLDVTAETATNALGTYHTLTATTGSAGNHEIDFEIDCVSGCSGATYTKVTTTGAADSSGGPTTVVETPTDGDQAAGTADDTRDVPELSCNTNGGSTCTVSYTRTGSGGEDLIAGWVDQNKTNESNDSDTTEGRDESTAAGAVTESDDTDVVSKNWFTSASANTKLDCDDDDDTDTETNPQGQAETYTCRAFNNNGTAGTSTDDTAVSGQVIDGENLGGANDPDNGSTNPADYNNACTTGADGTCTITINAIDNEVGAASICFWIDEDNDNQFDLTSSEFDGGECDSETDTGDEATTDDSTNKTDRVQKTWAQTGVAANLDATPERDTNVKGTTHTVTAKVTDQFGNVSTGTPVDFVLEAGSANVAQARVCDNVVTNASGEASCTYTDSTTVVGGEPETDTIEACVDATDDDVCDASDATTDEIDTDLADQVEKFWFTTIPTTADLVLDADANDGGCETTDATAENSDTAAIVDAEQEMCVTAFSNTTGTVQAGAEVTVTISGPGEFYNDANDNDSRDTGEALLGKTTTVTTNNAGQARVDLYSEETGTATVTATSGSQTDSVTMSWTNDAGDGRNLNCDPETATNPSGTEHVITCTLTDRFGNPVNGVSITANETGPGRITSSPLNTNTQGVVEFVTSTTGNESGTQTITPEITADVGDADTSADVDEPCDQAAGTTLAAEAGGASTTADPAPAGNCEDAVEKTWTDEPTTTDPACSDGVDNDGDGKVDGFDPGCDSVDDDDETDPAEPEPTFHSRTAKITKFRHITLPGKRKPALKVRGTVTSPDFESCATNVPVKVQIRAGGEWVTRKTDTTNSNGVWKVLIRDVRGKYRVVATRFQIEDPDQGTLDICRKARDVKRHRH
jgi:adhesin/invasin